MNTVKKNLLSLLLILAALPVAAQPTGSIVGAAPGGYTRLPFNFSFVPGIGIGDMIGGRIISVISINALGGRFEQLDGAEFGGIMNWETERASGAQFAGVINLVEGPVSGFQAAGVINLAAENVRGLQAAGVVNLADGDVSAGQLAGVLNLCRSSTGLQAAGVLNRTSGTASGLQAAGVANLAGESIDGAQIAGVVNIAGRVHGAQIGLVNIADENDGVPIGLFSLVRNVPIRAEVWGDETGFISAAVRSGNGTWYSLLGLTSEPGHDGGRWGFVAGFGHHSDLSTLFSIDVDLTSSSILDDGRWDEMSELSKLRVIGGWEPFAGVRLIAGPTLNVQTSWSGAAEDLAPRTIWERRDEDLFVKIWPGAILGLRLF